jgi:hypothetical protein
MLHEISQVNTTHSYLYEVAKVDPEEVEWELGMLLSG